MDLIRSGKAPEVIRRKGAEGTLPLPEGDKIEILTLLARSPEADLREKALETIKGLGRAEMLRVAANPQTAPDVLHYAAEHLLPEREEAQGTAVLESQPAEGCARAAATKEARTSASGCGGKACARRPGATEYSPRFSCSGSGERVRGWRCARASTACRR